MPFVGYKRSHDDDSPKEICIEGNLDPDVTPCHPEWRKSVPVSSDSKGGLEKTTFRKVHQKMIRTTEHAIRIQIELDEAREELFRWKRTQSSKIYAHTGPTTRRLLDTQRKTYAQTVFNLEKQLTRALNDLSELSCRQKFGAHASGESDDNGFESYIDELSQWIESLHHLVPQPRSSGTEDQSMWTWNQIEASVVVLNDLCGKFAELSLYQRYANVDSEKDDTMMRESANMKRGKEAVIPFLHDERAKLRQRIAEEGEELVQLQAKLQHLENLHSQMQKRLNTYTQWAEEDAAKIQMLSKGVELLYMLPNPAIQPPRDVLETTSEFVADESKKIAAEYFGKLVALCLQSHDTLRKDLDGRMLQSVRQLTQGIYKHAVDVEARDSGQR